MVTKDTSSPPSKPRSLPWHKVDDLSPAQLAAMQSLDDSRRAGLVSAEDAAIIERVIRAGHVHGARKRLTQARKRATETGRGLDPPSGTTTR